MKPAKPRTHDDTPRCGLCQRELTIEVPICACMERARTMPSPSAMYLFVGYARAGHTLEHAAALATGRAGQA